MIETWRTQAYTNIASYTHSEVPRWMQEVGQSLLRDSMIDLVDALTRERQPLERIVDLGCGIGDWTARWARLAHGVVGIDVNESFLEEATRRGYANSQVRFELGDLRAHRDFRPGDLVCFGACLMLVEDQELEALFARMAAAHQPGDFAYVRTTCAHGDRARYATEGGRYRAVAEYLALFQRHGYEVVFSESSLGAVLVRRALRELNQDAIARTQAWLGRPLRAIRALSRGADFYNFLLVRK